METLRSCLLRLRTLLLFLRTYNATISDVHGSEQRQSKTLRRIDHAHHSRLTVSHRCAVEPHWVCAIDRDGERLTPWFHEAGVERRIAGRPAGIAGGAFSHRVIWGREVEFDLVSDGSREAVWREVQAAKADLHGVDR